MISLKLNNIYRGYISYVFSRYSLLSASLAFVFGSWLIPYFIMDKVGSYEIDPSFHFLPISKFFSIWILIYTLHLIYVGVEKIRIILFGIEVSDSNRALSYKSAWFTIAGLMSCGIWQLVFVSDLAMHDFRVIIGAFLILFGLISFTNAARLVAQKMEAIALLQDKLTCSVKMYYRLVFIANAITASWMICALIINLAQILQIYLGLVSEKTIIISMSGLVFLILLCGLFLIKRSEVLCIVGSYASFGIFLRMKGVDTISECLQYLPLCLSVFAIFAMIAKIFTIQILRKSCK